MRSIPSTKEVLQDKPTSTRTMAVFPSPVSFFIQLSLGIEALLIRCQIKITEESFKIPFPIFITITVISTPKVRNNHKHTPLNSFVITISINVFVAKVKTHENSSVHNLRITPSLNGSNWTPIGLETWREMLNFFCRNSTGTKEKLVEVRFAIQLL